VNVLDLFSGIGGFSLGLESTGFFKTIAFVEKDEFCQKVLRKNFPNVPIEDEVRNVKGERFKADVITGGFPCQAFSVAGKRRGTEDDRYLWDETFRIISEQKPKWFCGENVEGIINIQDGLVFRQIHDDLESEGFEVQSLVIPASGVGAWHQRKRVWIIGCNVSNSKRNKYQHSTIRQSRTNKIWGFYSEKEKQATHDIRSKTSRCDGVSGTQSWWEAQSKFCRNVNGLSTTMDKDRANRIKSLGNSIVPQIAREIGKAIIEAETNV
jgi:DNA (cytosine-5)-methyltransferase 1